MYIYLGILYHTAGLIHMSYKDYIHIPHVPFVRMYFARGVRLELVNLNSKMISIHAGSGVIIISSVDV